MMAASSTVGMLRTNVIALSVPPLKQRQGLPAPATMVVECSSRPQKKATAHHMKTRPKKTQPWDVKRKGPTPYPPLPTLPPDWTLVSSSAEEEEGEGEGEGRRVVATSAEAAP